MNIWTPLNFDYRRRPRGKTNENAIDSLLPIYHDNAATPLQSSQPTARRPFLCLFVEYMNAERRTERTSSRIENSL